MFSFVSAKGQLCVVPTWERPLTMVRGKVDGWPDLAPQDRQTSEAWMSDVRERSEGCGLGTFLKAVFLAVLWKIERNSKLTIMNPIL